MHETRTRGTSGKRIVLLAVAGLLSAAAALAIGILLFGDFGATEGRILTSTAVLGGYALLTLPAAILEDQRRLPALVLVIAALAVVGASLSLVSLWQDEPSDLLARTTGTVAVWLVAVVQVGALVARQAQQDPRLVRRLFAASCVTGAAAAVMISALIWAKIDSVGYARIFASVVVLDALLVALQPILARARPVATVHRLRVVVAPHETVELAVAAPDIATAATRAVRGLEREGRQVLRLEFADRTAFGPLREGRDGRRAGVGGGERAPG